MAIELVQASNDPEGILTTPTKPVEDDPSLAKEIYLKLRAGIATNPNLVGLAANQIGINASVCLVLIGHEEKKLRWLTMVNPMIIEKGRTLAFDIEGCGSLRKPKELYYEVERPTEITVSFLDTSGHKMGVKLHDYSARVAQHEIDHLNGILISDHGRLVSD